MPPTGSTESSGRIEYAELRVHGEGGESEPLLAVVVDVPGLGSPEIVRLLEVKNPPLPPGIGAIPIIARSTLLPNLIAPVAASKPQTQLPAIQLFSFWNHRASPSWVFI